MSNTTTRWQRYNADIPLLLGCLGVGCLPTVDDSGTTGWPTRLVYDDSEQAIGAADPNCTDVVAVILHDDAEWQTMLGKSLPVRHEEFGPTPVDWVSEDAIFASTDCSFIGLSLQLVVLDGVHDGPAEVTYLIDLPTTGMDVIGRTFAIHAFSECGTCDLASVVTERAEAR